MDKNNPSAKLIAAFVMIILGSVLAMQVADVVNGKTETIPYTQVINHTDGGVINPLKAYTLTYSPSGTWKTEYSDCNVTTVVVTNISDTMTRNTDYIFSQNNWTLTFINTSKMSLGGDNSYVSYDYCGDEYMATSYGRTAMNMAPGLFALALFIMSAFLLVSIIRDAGVE